MTPLLWLVSGMVHVWRWVNPVLNLWPQCYYIRWGPIDSWANLQVDELWLTMATVVDIWYILSIFYLQFISWSASKATQKHHGESERVEATIQGALGAVPVNQRFFQDALYRRHINDIWGFPWMGVPQ